MRTKLLLIALRGAQETSIFWSFDDAAEFIQDAIAAAKQEENSHD